CFITDRVYYVVSNGELRNFSSGGPSAGRLMANDVTSTAPFSIPTTPLGAQYNRFVAALSDGLHQVLQHGHGAPVRTLLTLLVWAAVALPAAARWFSWE
ncbi:MAG: hypothetical protein ABI775_07750, partial [Pseudonocardiales bacterium]